MEKTTVGEGRFSLMIRGEALQKQELAEKLSLTATGLIRKGNCLAAFPALKPRRTCGFMRFRLRTPREKIRR